MVAQAIVDCKKKIIDVFVSLLGSVNDLKVLHKCGLYRNAQYHGLFTFNNSTFQHGFPPHFLSDKGYPLITWIMIPFKEEGQHTTMELLYNRKHKQGCFVLENVFGIFKKKFKRVPYHN